MGKIIDPALDGHLTRLMAARDAAAARHVRGLVTALLALLVGLALPNQAMPSASDGVPVFLAARKPIAAPAGFAGLCQSHRWLCARSGAGATVPGDALGRAAAINRAVNHGVRQISDRRQYGRDEVWALPTRRGGDCEDLAMLKKQKLIAAGMPAERLLLATALDRRRQPHAVLILRTARGDLVLDNLTDRILPWQATGYSFIKMQNPDRPSRWDAVLAGGIFDRRG